MQGMQIQSPDGEDPLEEGVTTTSVFLPGESHNKGTSWAIVHIVAKNQT